MKTLPKIFLFLFMGGAIITSAADKDEASFRWIPKPGAEWTPKGQRSLEEKGDHYQAAWATFVNASTGDILAFAMDRYAGTNREVGGGAMQQSGNDMFPGGYPRFARKEFWPTGWNIYFVRSNVVTLGTGALPGKWNRDFKALEFTYIYEDEMRKSPNRMGHGYAIAFGDTVFYVQETSTHVITDEDAQSMAIELARAQLDRGPG
jgi:hypothetical protein